MEKKVYIFEAEKSCMKAYDMGIYNTLAIGASDMSQEQVDIAKSTGLNVEIVLCYDKGIEEKMIKSKAEMFTGRKVSYIYDTDDLLGNKDAPVDKGYETWKKLEGNYIKEFIPEKVK